MLRKLALSLAVAGALGISNANALGLGEIRIKSALNEPLKAEIQLLQMRELDPQQVQPRMANIDDFALAGIEKLRFLSDVNFEVKPGAAGRGTIIMTSSAPVKEPFLNFLVEVNWPSGRLVREYTVLLDPPVYDPTPQTTAVQPAQSQSVTAPATMTAQPLSASAPLDNIKTRLNPQSQIYVDVNDTLWNLAKKYKPAANITEAQMMLALQRKNPAAFTNNNVNQLKAGVVLDIPTLDEAKELTHKQANEEFWRQTGIWKQGGVVTQPKGEQLDANAGKEQTTEKKRSEVASSTAQGQLKIVSAAQQKDAESGAVTDQAADTQVTKENSALLEKNQQLEAELASALETVDMIQRENAEIAGRVDSLAEQMTSLQRLLEIKDNQIAELQAELDAAKKQPLIAPPAQQPQKKGLLEEFGLYIAGAAAAVVALLVALLFFVMGRRRKQAKDDTEAADSEEVAALVDLPEEIEEDTAEEIVADPDEVVSEVEPEDAEVDELSDLVDEDLDDLSDLDLDLEMDLEEVAPGVDDVIDDEEFNLGLEDEVLEADQPVVDEALETTGDEQIDDALDSILGEDAESLDLNVVSEVDDIEDLLSSVESAGSVDEEELDDELAFEIQPLNDDVVESVVEEDSFADLSDEAVLDFNLDAELEDELSGEAEEVIGTTTLPEIEEESEELPDLDELFGSDFDVTEALGDEDGSLVDSEDELADLDDLLVGAVDTVEEDNSEDAGVDEIADLDDLDDLLVGAVDAVEEDGSEDAELDEISDLDDLLVGAVDTVEEDDSEDAGVDEISDLDDLLVGAVDTVEEDDSEDAKVDEISDLDDLLVGAVDTVEEGGFEDTEVDEISDLDDLDDLLVGAVDAVEEDGFEDVEVDEISDLEELLGADQESDLNLSVDDDIADLDALLGASVEEAAQPVLADDNDLHSELEQLLDSVADDVVLEELDVSAEPDSMDDLEASISHDLDAELDSELEELLSGAGDSDISLSEDDGVDDGSFDSFNLLEGADEVETKLDLARAYIDMEDLDGAKDILQEIIKEGSDTQQQEANTLIDSLTN